MNIKWNVNVIYCFFLNLMFFLNFDRTMPHFYQQFLLAFVPTSTLPQLCPNYFFDFSSIFKSTLPKLYLNYAQRDYVPNFAFCPNYARVLPQLCFNYVSVGYQVA